MDDAQFPIYDLSTCLQAQAYRSLVAIARFHDWPFDTSRVKTQVVEGLVQRLRAPEHIAAMLAALGNEARAALRTLLHAGGQLAQAEFVYRFGEFRPYRPWREDAPDAPWTQPRSPTETLVYCGLIFPLNLGTAERPVHVFAMPTEYRKTLRDVLQVDVQAIPPAQATEPALLQHLFAFLSYLNRTSVEPLHGRWLAPRHFRELAAFLEPYAAQAETARSELQFRYLAFVHYLAEHASLVDLTAGYLRPTSTAWDWLDRPPQVQYQTLWDAWRELSEPNRALWRRYRLPLQQEEEPLARLQQLVTVLPQHPPTGVLAEDYITVLQAYAPRLFRPRAAYQAWGEISEASQAAYRAQIGETLARLLTGPLVWFGVLRLDEGRLFLTPLGAALIGRASGDWLNPRSPVRLSVRLQVVDTSAESAGTQIQLQVVPRRENDEGLLTPVRRLVLERFAPPDPEQPGTYTLAREPVLVAFQQGQRADGLLTLLEQTAGPLPPPVVGACYRWAAAVDRLQVRRITVLEAQDAALLRELTGERRIRETLLETLSDRIVRVDASQLEGLVRRLAYRDLYPRLDLPAQAAAPQSDLSVEERITIGAALALYASLADRLGADVRPPHTLARQWRQRLTAAERDAGDRQVERLFNALQGATPPPTEDHLPVPTGEHLTVLEQAIAAGATVEIRYYTAGRDHVTQRQVDPLRLEWRGEVAYLIAHCHLRQAQRVFRVDRIEALKRTGS
jgi:hypothetical protein